MIGFLSREWFDAVGTALGELDPATLTGPPLTIRQQVHGHPDGELTYAFHIGGGRALVSRDDAEPADIAFSQSYETACGVARGELSALDAVREGRITVTGDPTLLVSHAASLAALDEALAGVRHETDFHRINGD